MEQGRRPRSIMKLTCYSPICVRVVHCHHLVAAAMTDWVKKNLRQASRVICWMPFQRKKKLASMPYWITVAIWSKKTTRSRRRDLTPSGLGSLSASCGWFGGAKGAQWVIEGGAATGSDRAPRGGRKVLWSVPQCCL